MSWKVSMWNDILVEIYKTRSQPSNIHGGGNTIIIRKQISSIHLALLSASSAFMHSTNRGSKTLRKKKLRNFQKQKTLEYLSYADNYLHRFIIIF